MPTYPPRAQDEDTFAQTFAESVRTGYATLHEFTGALWRIWDRDRWHVPLQIGSKVPCVGDWFEFPPLALDELVGFYPVFWSAEGVHLCSGAPTVLPGGGAIRYPAPTLLVS